MARITYKIRPNSLLAAAVDKPCPYCNAQMRYPDHRPTRDHLLSRVHRVMLPDDALASIVDVNKIVVCHVCNHAKKSHTLIEWLGRLISGRDPRAVHVSAFIDRIIEKHPGSVGFLLCYGPSPGRRYTPEIEAGISA